MGGIIEDVKIARQLTASTSYKKGFFRKQDLSNVLELKKGKSLARRSLNKHQKIKP
jgi:hypothetical protein